MSRADVNVVEDQVWRDTLKRERNTCKAWDSDWGFLRRGEKFETMIATNQEDALRQTGTCVYSEKERKGVRVLHRLQEIAEPPQRAGKELEDRFQFRQTTEQALKNVEHKSKFRKNRREMADPPQRSDPKNKERFKRVTEDTFFEQQMASIPPSMPRETRKFKADLQGADILPDEEEVLCASRFLKKNPVEKYGSPQTVSQEVGWQVLSKGTLEMFGVNQFGKRGMKF